MNKTDNVIDNAVKKNGVSLIVCAINLKLCEQMLESIKNTIGTEFETIVFDNNEARWGICNVYNHCASKAKYKYLCFVHEDVIMGTPDWGRMMIEFIEKTPNCGVIGFAGSRAVVKNFTGWGFGVNTCYNFYDPKKKGKSNNVSELIKQYNNPHNDDFSETVVLDGMFLFTAHRIWQEFPFDEKNIRGFHFYDSDFTFAIAQKKRNFVCFKADIYHLSNGNFDKIYWKTAKFFQNKWKEKLPFCVSDEKITLSQEAEYLQISIQNLWHLTKINGLNLIPLLFLGVKKKLLKKVRLLVSKF